MTDANQPFEIVGHYTCEGGDYRGEVVIRDINDSYAIHWVISGSVQAGIGLRSGNTLSVSVAVPVSAVALYEIHGTSPQGLTLQGRYSSFPSGGPVHLEVLSFVRELRTWEIGDNVLAKWSRDPFWYPATVIEKADDDRYGVQFADGDQEWLGRSCIMPELLTVGDIVFNTSGLLHRDDTGERIATTVDPQELDDARIGHRCRIIGRDGEAVRVQYDDGATVKTKIANIRTMAPREG